MKSALVTHLGEYIDGMDDIEETTCDDNLRRRLGGGGAAAAAVARPQRRLSTKVTLGFTVTVAVEEAGYDSNDTDGLASDLANTLTTAVSSGAIASTIATNAGDASSFQSAALHADLSIAAIATATAVTAVESTTHMPSKGETAGSNAEGNTADEDGSSLAIITITGACGLVAICGGGALFGLVLARKMLTTSAALCNDDQATLVPEASVVAMATAIDLDSRKAGVEMAPIPAVAVGSQKRVSL